jgi:hypothetical protein
MTELAARAFRGRMATVTELPPATNLPLRSPEQAATLSNWFVHAPAAHPFWPRYLFFCVHLRDIEGQSQPPKLRFPEASHEINLIALNPEIGPWTAENVVEKLLSPRTASAILTPFNLSEQIAGATDEQACELTELLARGIADGHVPIEPDDVRNGRDLQRAIIAKTLEHIKLGSHPEDN